MSTQTTPRPEGSTADPVRHRPRPAPDEHLCTCGGLREECVRRAVLLLWG